MDARWRVAPHAADDAEADVVEIVVAAAAFDVTAKDL